MQKLGLSQLLQQKLSPQQIQFIKLLQVPTAELEQRIKEELEENPALEDGFGDSLTDNYADSDPTSPEDTNKDEDENLFDDSSEEISMEDYLSDDYSGYKMQGDGPSDEEEKEMPLASNLSLQESLIVQLGFLRMSERETLIGRQIIGSLDDDGYLRREPSAISNDLAFAHNIDTDTEEIEAVLFKAQEFDPPGIAARDLRECFTFAT